MDERRTIGPAADELPALVAGLAEEVDDLLSSSRWRLVLTSSTVAHHVHAAAGLRHVVALLEDVASAVAQRREAAIRILGRAHLEAWLVAIYVTVYGDDALADIQAGYMKAISSQHTRLAEYDESLNREIAKINEKNLRIRDRNRDLQRWNEAHPGAPSKPLTDEMPLPRRTAVALDLAAAIDDGPADEDQPPPLPLAAIVARLNEYGRAQEGPDALLDMVYDLGYRGLSTLGAHPTLWVLDAYVDHTERSTMVSTVPEMRAVSMGRPVLHTAVLLTAALIQKVMGLKGHEAPMAASVSARYQRIGDE